MSDRTDVLARVRVLAKGSPRKGGKGKKRTTKRQKKGKRRVSR